jgi:hypothetical protein
VADAAGFNANAHLAGTRVLEESSHFRELSWARDLYGSVKSRSFFTPSDFACFGGTSLPRLDTSLYLRCASLRPGNGHQASEATHGFRLGRLVVKDVTVLGELAVLDANDVGGDPGGRAAMARETAVGDNIGGNGRRGLHRPRHFPCAVVLRSTMPRRPNPKE